MNSSLMLSYWGRRVAKKLMNPQFKPKRQPVTNRWNIVRGDMVQVIQGPQTGQKGKVLKVLRESNRLIIDGVNMVMIDHQHTNKIFIIPFDEFYSFHFEKWLVRYN